MGLSRRNFLAHGAVAAGAVAVVGQQTAGVAGASAPAESGETWWGTGPTESEPFVVYIRNAAKGEVAVLLGEQEVVYVDRPLVARLQRTMRRNAW